MLNLNSYTSHIKRLLHLNVVVILIFIVVSVSLLVSHKYGAFDIKADLLSEQFRAYTAPLMFGNTEGQLLKVNGNYESVCILENTAGYNNCGISIRLLDAPNIDPQDTRYGLNLASYNTIELSLRYNSPTNDGQVRVSFRTFDPELSTVEDAVSLKFNSVVFAPNEDYATLNIPFNAFKVDDWWIGQFNVPFEKANTDFSNLVFLDIISHSMTEPGEYRYQINRAIVYGKRVSEAELLEILFVLGLVVILWLSNRQARIMQDASKTDILTGLYNRRGANELIGKVCFRGTKKNSFLFHFDIDGFKAVNDIHGHQIGDTLLLQIAQRTELTFTQFSNLHQLIIARLGGDEFCVFIQELTEQQALALAEQIVSAMSRAFSIDRRIVKVGASLGLVKLSTYHRDFESLLNEADMAMYVAKREGKNKVKVFDESVKVQIRENKQIVQTLNDALANDSFFLVFMPIVDSYSNKVKKSEVLLRTICPQLTAIGTERFINVAEEFGIIEHIDMWVIDKSLDFIKRNEQLLQQRKIQTSINVSAKEMSNLQFCNFLESCINKYKIDPSLIELEITETSFSEINANSISILGKLQIMGISLSLDDFGTGYSAFHHIEQYPVDVLKIDKSFIDRYQQEMKQEASVISAMISIAHFNGLTVVAEGVESQEQAEYLRSLRCDMLQGYYFSKPVIESEYLHYLASKTK